MNFCAEVANLTDLTLWQTGTGRDHKKQRGSEIVLWIVFSFLTEVRVLLSPQITFHSSKEITFRWNDSCGFGSVPELNPVSHDPLACVWGLQALLTVSEMIPSVNKHNHTSDHSSIRIVPAVIETASTHVGRLVALHLSMC